MTLDTRKFQDEVNRLKAEKERVLDKLLRVNHFFNHLSFDEQIIVKGMLSCAFYSGVNVGAQKPNEEKGD